ncbi:MAG TPA: 30S ribosomal protein THX [Candidatus Sphingobacterium stercoripullorum]|uniref:30S ribosomal protein THX n=1 Tax=Candidatus Sphingobacterium stercoripullorum TaxID=2838759 RepID=A0A9D1W9R5_9SPHI|nr:30S ribosomal protein THX [Candidatus Sphingobacterium stercoripullorum]
MGKGDRKTKKGKIFLGSYGKTRPRKHVNAPVGDKQKDSK